MTPTPSRGWPAPGAGRSGSTADPAFPRERLPSAWLLLLGAILSEVTATVSLRGALDDPVLYVVVVLGYALSFGLLALVLRRGMPLGVAYGIWSACGVVLTALLSALLFGEVFTVLKATGIVLIAGGVVLVELGSQRAQRAEAR